MTGVYIGLGTNIGDRKANLGEALRRIGDEDGIEVEAVSGILETAPVDFLDQPVFLNQMVRVKTRYTPQELLSILKKIEQDMGRVPSLPKGPRIIDLDIILYGTLVLRTAELVVPHGEMLRRDFIMDHLLELDPELVDPVSQKKISEVRHGTEKHQ